MVKERPRPKPERHNFGMGNVPPPKNSFRAEVSTAEAIYRRPTWLRVLAGVFSLFFFQMLSVCLLLTLLLLLPIPLPGRHPI